MCTSQRGFGLIKSFEGLRLLDEARRSRQLVDRLRLETESLMKAVHEYQQRAVGAHMHLLH